MYIMIMCAVHIVNALIKQCSVIMFILFCYFYDYVYQCSLIIAYKMLVSR